MLITSTSLLKEEFFKPRQLFANINVISHWVQRHGVQHHAPLAREADSKDSSAEKTRFSLDRVMACHPRWFADLRRG